MSIKDTPFYHHHEANVLIDARIRELDSVKSVEEIAAEVGFTGTRMIELIRHGDAAVRLDNVEAFAQALSIDPVVLFLKTIGGPSSSIGRFVASLFPLGPLTTLEIELVRKHRNGALTETPE